MTGSGAYDMKPVLRELKQAMKPMVKSALIQGGGILGGMTGIPSGKNFGSELGRRISRLIGSGDYAINDVSTNSLIKGAVNPGLSFGDTTSIRMQHREFLGDIYTSSVAGAFVNYTYPINAGLRSTFPYLSQVANNFEHYCFNGLVFEFVSTASPYISTSALGSNIASMEYNSSLPAYNSKFSMENSACAISTRLDRSLMYGVECAKGSNAQNCYYVRSGSSTLPITTTDLGLFQLAISPGAGVPTSSVIGELWVTYDVELARPYLDLSRTGSFTFSNTGTLDATPLGTASTVAVTGGALSGTTTSSTAITIPSLVTGDVVQIELYWLNGTAAAFTSPTITVTNGKVGYYTGIGAASLAPAPQNTVIANRISVNFFVQCTNTGPVVITLAGAVLPTLTTRGVFTGASIGNFPLDAIVY